MKLFVYTFITFYLLAINSTRAQNSIVKPNTIYVELLGSGGLYSLNYERFLIVGVKKAYGIRVGGSYWNSQTPYTNVIGELIGLLGGGKNHLDFGLGFVRGSAPDRTISSHQKRQFLYAVPRIGYRYQRTSGGTMIRLGVTPFISLNSETPTRQYTYPLYIGLAIGHSF